MNYITSLLLLSSNTFLHPTTTYLQSMNDSIVLVTSSVSTELTALAYDPISTISGVNGTNNIDYIKLLNDTNSTFVQLDNSDTDIDDSSSNSEDVSSNDEQIALMNSSSDFSDESDEGNDSDDNGDEVENMENNQANESDTQNENDRVLNYDTSSSENENENEMKMKTKNPQSKSKSKSSKLKHKSRKSHKRRPKLLKSKDVETNEITTVEVITLTITKVLARHDLAAIVTPIQQHQSGHLIIGYPLPIATKSRLMTIINLVVTGSVPPRYSNHHSEFTVERPPRPSRTKKRPRIKAKKTMKVSTQISSAMSKSIHITRIGSTSSGIASGYKYSDP
ncbi:hypothetical protein FOB64_001315 [Candida albicans]|uniref:Uncharacterized protein n=2 Tax=Candida albicans TaxID=5476 RepID=A0A8H6C562_CANAX|nr:hypothetical protein FOB64_001315 [Candida albicans]